MEQSQIRAMVSESLKGVISQQLLPTVDGKGRVLSAGHTPGRVGMIDTLPARLAGKLEAVMRAGANLDFVIARRQPQKSGTGVVFLAPLIGQEQVGAAEDVGFQKASGLHSIRIVGPDRPGGSAGLGSHQSLPAGGRGARRHRT